MNVADDQPIESPRWLIIFAMITECDIIFRSSQTQPSNPHDWALLNWAYSISENLPPTSQEADRPTHLIIPPFFEYREETEASAPTNYRVKTYI